MKGCYVLVARLDTKQSIAVGSLGKITFQSGYYAYIGSALGGFKPRLNRHLRQDKQPKWHIDYLLQKAHLKSIVICETAERLECCVANALNGKFQSITHFGSSDCKCAGHLYVGDDSLETEIMVAVRDLGLNPQKITNFNCIQDFY